MLLLLLLLVAAAAAGVAAAAAAAVAALVVVVAVVVGVGVGETRHPQPRIQKFQRPKLLKPATYCKQLPYVTLTNCPCSQLSPCNRNPNTLHPDHYMLNPICLNHKIDSFVLLFVPILMLICFCALTYL